MTTGSTTRPLLEKKLEGKVVYYENCPGCKQERKNQANPGIPYKEFLYVWVVALCSALPISSLFPFIYFMIRDLHIAKREEDIGFYAGFVGCSFMVGRALTSMLWGIIADNYGRKPVIVISILSTIVFNTLFGLSTSFWMAITTRFLLGLLCGLLGPVKAYASEVGPKEHQALGLSLVSTSRGIGLIIGPAIGGYLSQPADKFPSIFSQESIFGRFPYFLPCLCISLFAVCAFIACLWLPETLHMHEGSGDGANGASDELPFGSDLEESNGDQPEEKGQQTPHHDESLLKNWALLSSITLYCIFSLHDTAYVEVFSLWAESDKRFGGLSFSTEDVGEVLTLSGFALLLYQLFFFHRFEKALGPVTLSRVAAVLNIPVLACFPFMAKMSGLGLLVIVNIASIVKNILSITIITGVNILQNNAVPQHQRGTANGISVTAMSIFKAIAPAGGGIIFSWAQKRQDVWFLPGDQMVFFALNLVALVGLILTFKPFIALPKVNYLK